MGEKKKRSAMFLAVTFCVLCFPVLSNGFDLPLPFLKEARRRDSEIETDQNNNRQRGSLSELLPSSRVNSVPKGELSDIMRSSSPPRHIVKLLENMSKDQDLLQRSGNTVRSAVPVRKNTCGKDTFIFSLRTLEITEQLDSIELHYFVRKLKRWADENLRLNIQINHIDNDSLCHEIGSLELTSDARGWQKLNLTSYIESFMNETSPKIKIGVTFTAATDQGRERMSKSLVRKMLSKHVQPFMLVYTEDKTATDEAGHLSWERLTKDISSHSRLKPVHSRRARSIANIFNKNNTYLATNNFPDDHDITNMAEATFPVFAERNSQRRKARKKEKEREKEKEKEKKRRNRKKNKDKGGKKTKFEPLLDHNSGESDADQNKHDNTIRPSKLELCSRQPMRVDFKAIGWDDWIIAPEGFDAFYCAGQCPFPLAKELNPPNHAAVQSVVSALGAIPNIPAPCCVPEKMSPINLLYFDEDDNVMLKNYSNMVVDSCSCR